MIVYNLDAMFSGSFAFCFILYIAGYIVLVLISVAFAFGFYWRFLEQVRTLTEAAGRFGFRGPARATDRTKPA